MLEAVAGEEGGVLFYSKNCQTLWVSCQYRQRKNLLNWNLLHHSIHRVAVVWNLNDGAYHDWAVDDHEIPIFDGVATLKELSLSVSASGAIAKTPDCVDGSHVHLVFSFLLLAIVATNRSPEVSRVEERVAVYAPAFRFPKLEIRVR